MPSKEGVQSPPAFRSGNVRMNRVSRAAQAAPDHR
jgi:hypothetical protein